MIFGHFFKNQRGISLPLVIVLISGSIGTIGYLAVNLIPKLQDGKKKAEQAIEYKIFLNSLNDYLVHGIRERWCINVISNAGGIVESDLLLSNACSQGTPMEDVVTFPGNLERILWDNTIIGGTGSTSGVTIMGMNQKKYLMTPPKASRLLTEEEIRLPDETLKLRITEAILNDMTDVHPLFKMSQDVKNCIDQVDITVKRVNDNVIGEEKKLRIDIVVDVKETSLTCLAHKRVQNTSYYTFYPRRLHNFALIKYDDMDASKWMEFHGPVYLAGNLNLPAQADPKSMIFYDTLTLGTYNGGTGSNEYYAGRLMINSNPYTFVERGDPYKSKQDYYDTFRGILGGLRLDAVEDKGLYNIFDKNIANGADVATLEQCIDENTIKTTPSKSNGTVLAFTNVSASPGANNTVAGNFSFRMGMTLKNRFKPSINAPAALINSPDTPDRKFEMTVPATANGVQALAQLSLNLNSDNNFTASMGDNSSVIFKIELAKYSIDTAAIDTSVDLLDAITTKATYPNAIPSGSILRNVSEYQAYLDAADDLIDKCDNKAAIDQCPTQFSDYANPCDPASDTSCNPPTNEYNGFIAAELALKNKLLSIKNDLTSTGDPTMTVALSPIMNTNNKLIINHKNFAVSFSPKWKTFFPLIADTFPNATLEFKAYHYGSDPLQFRLPLIKQTSVLLEILNQTNNQNETLSSFSGWRNTYNNGNFPGDPPVELIEIDCPTGMGLADWDMDMSSSTNFAWNYENTQAGVPADGTTHENLASEEFTNDSPHLGNYKGSRELTKSVVDNCKIKKERTHVYGFYVCETLEFESGRSEAAHMIGTFIVKNLVMNFNNVPIHWHSVWTPTARDLVLTDLNEQTATCSDPTMPNKTFKDLQMDWQLKAQIKKCSPQELVTNGPNNFNWTTTDPEIGIDPANPTMTSEKIHRAQRWVLREDSRKEIIQ